LLEAMEYDVPYTSKALMEKLGIKFERGIPKKLSSSHHLK